MLILPSLSRWIACLSHTGFEMPNKQFGHVAQESQVEDKLSHIARTVSTEQKQMRFLPSTLLYGFPSHLTSPSQRNIVQPSQLTECFRCPHLSLFPKTRILVHCNNCHFGCYLLIYLFLTRFRGPCSTSYISLSFYVCLSVSVSPCPDLLPLLG